MLNLPYVCGRHGQRLVRVASLVLMISSPTDALADGLVVFDPLNYNQSVLSAIRTLQQINIQIVTLSRQTQMLINSTKNVTSASENISGQLKANIDAIVHLMSRAGGLTFNVSMTANQFQSAYPREYSSASSAGAMAQDANARRNNTYQAFYQALLAQSQAIEALNADSASLAAVMARSSSAIGALQAQQANNELLALQARQSMQSQTLTATEARASTLREAEREASEAAALEQFRRFIGNGRAYASGK